MTATARLLDQRSLGQVKLRMERDGVSVLREAGCAKVRVPRGSREAILINVSGGLAGGDRIDIECAAGRCAGMTVTTQAAERVYRTIGPPARVNVHLTVEDDASLFWLPQETICFDGSALSRHIDVDLGANTTFVAMESMVFGRTAMGEKVDTISIKDRWNIKQDGKLVHAEAFALGPEFANSKATLSGHLATATILIVAQTVQSKLEAIRSHLSPSDGASAWNGKLVVRLLAATGYDLRKRLMTILAICLGEQTLPKCWTC
jgi:urease accessory protein